MIPQIEQKIQSADDIQGYNKLQESLCYRLAVEKTGLTAVNGQKTSLDNVYTRVTFKAQVDI